MATLIEWTHLQNSKYQYSGDSVNPLGGCRKISPACTNCYAISTAKELRRRFGVNHFDVVESQGFNWNGKVFFDPKTMSTVMAKNKKPKAYFMCSLSDFALGNDDDCRLLDVDETNPSHPYALNWQKAYQPKQTHHRTRIKLDFYRDVIMSAICYAYHDNPNNKFLILTKRPDVLKNYLENLTENACVTANRLSAAMAWLLSVNEQTNSLSKKNSEVFHQPALFEFLKNVFKSSAVNTLKNNIWFGVTVENQSQINRIDILQSIPWGQKKFVSAEPLLGEISFNENHKFDWLILGGESGDKVRRTELHFFINTINSASLLSPKPAIFVKQLGKELAKDYPGQNKKGGNFDFMPKVLQLREFPEFE